MTKISQSRQLETSKFTATEAGKQLTDFITYMADVSENLIRAMRKGVGLVDNLDGSPLRVTLKHDTTTVVNTGDRVPLAMWPGRVFSTQTGIASFSWWVNDQGQVSVKAGFSGVTTQPRDVLLVALFS